MEEFRERDRGLGAREGLQRDSGPSGDEVEKQRPINADAEGGFGVLGYVLVTAGAIFALLKFFLKT